MDIECIKEDGKIITDYNLLMDRVIVVIQELTAKVEALEWVANFEKYTSNPMVQALLGELGDSENNNEQGESSNEQEQDSNNNEGDASSESSGEDSGGVEGNSSEYSDSNESRTDSFEPGSGISSESSDQTSENAGSNGGASSNDSEAGSGEVDSSGSGDEPSNGDPSSEWTKDQLKAYMDSNSISYNSGDTKQDLLDKIGAANG